MQHIENLIQQITRIESKIQLQHFFEQIIDVFGYEWAGLVVFKPELSDRYDISVFGSIPIKECDLIIKDRQIRQYCLHEIQPKSVALDTGVPNVSASSQATDDKILLVPIKGVGVEFAGLVFSLQPGMKHTEVIKKIGWFWGMLASFIYNQYKKYIAVVPNKITKRELECIKWASEGKTSWEISLLLSISQRTVDFHLANCITKTGSINRQQAIVKCMLDGQLLM